MIRHDSSSLSVRGQCELLSLTRSGLYYEPVEPSEDDEKLMRLIDETYLRWPFYGSRRMTLALRTAGMKVNRKHVQRLMRMMGLVAMAPAPGTSRPRKEDAKYPYLLRRLAITRPNQVWAADITYIPLARGFVYLVAIIDWYSRMVLSWRLSNTLDTSFCNDALDEALDRYGPPEIFNSDQGCQFTAKEFVDRLLAAGVAISRDGKGRCLDNVFVERLWRSLKYEEVYLKGYDSVTDAREGIGAYLRFFNVERPHQALGYRTPAHVFGGARTDGAPATKSPAAATAPRHQPNGAGQAPATPVRDTPGLAAQSRTRDVHGQNMARVRHQQVPRPLRKRRSSPGDGVLGLQGPRQRAELRVSKSHEQPSVSWMRDRRPAGARHDLLISESK
jgi:putative transposase